MNKYRQPAGFLAVLVLLFALALGPGFTHIAAAASEDVAMFYDDLSQYGQWADYGNYGAVWRPSQVPEDWRPYTDGRWVPTNDGYVFESQEPWSWATYHYGNWMPTEGQGWVWVPGRTWYPSTVEWRTSPETAPPEDSYVGWAPIPPPNYEPPPDYAQPSYSPGNPVGDALTAPFWIFAKAVSFLLGLGQPYAPEYSYVTTGVLVPPAYVPVFYPQTIIVQNYVRPAYYPPGFLGARRFGFAAYNWGPPPRYFYRVARINQPFFNRVIYNNSRHITRIYNVVPPRAVLNRYGYVRQIVPPALAQGRPLPRSLPVRDIRMAQANLYKPNILPPPREVPRINAPLPRLQPAAWTPGHGVPGTALPPRATMPLTPQMERQIQSLPAHQRFTPAPTPPFRPTALTQPGQPQPGFQPRPGQVQPGVPGQPGQVRPGTPPQPGRRGEFHPGTPPSGPPPAGTFTPSGAAKPGTTGPPQGTRGLTPEMRRQQQPAHQRLQRSGAPAQPPQQQQQRNQERIRQQQLQQQQRQQQERQRQLQIQHQQPQQRQLQERQRQIQIQQQRRQQEGQRHLQAQPQHQHQIQQQRPQPQRQPQQRQEQHRQQRQERENKKQEHQQ